MARRGRAGRLQRADHRRRAGLARGDDAARGRALPAPGRDPVQRPLHGADAARRTPTSRRSSSSSSTRASTRRGDRGARGRRGGRDRGARSTPSTASTRTASCAGSCRSCRRCCAPTTTCPDRSRTCRSSSTRRRSRWCRCRGRGSRSSCTRRGSRACTCAAGRSRAAACAGRDRREDFRTEILGLMKAQMVKNALIVPVGAKGGFVVKRAGDEVVARLHDVHQRAAGHHRHDHAAARSCRPRDVVRHDGDDPYLVVAADKGTATFSDIANGVAEDYGFWLGDAFASGGSVGYDHKAMGITARSAWVSVQRHFRELGVDVQARGLHRRRHRRHERRRVRQRDAAVRAHPARGGVRPPPHLPRPDPRRGGLARRAAAAVRAAALVVGGLRHVADLRGRRRLPAHGEVDRAVAAGARGAGRRRRVG